MGYFGEQVNILGVIELSTTFGVKLNIKTIDIRYLLVDFEIPYHMILERPSLNTIRAVVSTLHLALKFPILTIEVGVV